MAYGIMRNVVLYTLFRMTTISGKAVQIDLMVAGVNSAKPNIFCNSHIIIVICFFRHAVSPYREISRKK